MYIRKIIIGLAACFLLDAFARAATQRALDLPALVEGADIIIVGRAVEAETAWNPEHTRIYTHTTFTVEESLKGEQQDTLVIETLGGIAEGLGMIVPGMPVFRPGERDVIFVTTGRQTGTHRVLGWAQGRFRIQRETKTRQESLSRKLVGISLLSRLDPTLKSIRYLDELQEAIRQLLVRK